jgi:hypothetical protein
MFRFKPAAAALLSCLALLPAASARAAASCRPWLEMQAGRFRVISNLPASDTAAMIGSLARFQGAVRKLTTAEELRSPPTTVVFMRPDEWPSQRWGGMFVTRGDRLENLIMVPQYQDHFTRFHTVMHEYVHYVMHQQPGFTYPPWYDEGLAEVLSAVYEDRDLVRVGSISDDAFLTVDTHGLLLREVLQMQGNWDDQPDDAIVRLFYARAAVLVHYLMFASDLRHRQSDEYMALLNQGMDADRAFQKAFDTDYETLEREVAGYVLKGKVKWAGLKRAELPEAKIGAQRPLSCEDGWQEAGIALARQSPFFDAVREQWLVPLQAARPDRPGTLALQAVIAERDKRYDAADALWKRVLAAPEVSARWRILAADSWLQRIGSAGVSDNDMASQAYEQLVKADAPNSGNVAALFAFAKASLIAEKDLEPARIAAGQSYQTYPANPAIAEVAAILSEHAADWARAADYWSVVARTAKTPAQRERALARIEKATKR